MNIRLSRLYAAVCAALRDESAQGLVEYSIIVALVAMMAVATIRVLGHRVTNSLSSATNGFS